MFTGKFEFKKVELKNNARGSYNPRRTKTVYLNKNKNEAGKEIYFRATISGDLVKELGWKAGDRVDLLQCGTMFALQKATAGLFYLRHTGSKSQNSLCINSQNLCLHLITNTKRCEEYKAWVDGDMVIFIPAES